ncbi:hypothetical protein ACQP3C_26830, partial [Escherichia coli]
LLYETKEPHAISQESGGCLEMDPVISARPEHRVSASRALASFLWSQRPSPLGLRRNRRRSGRKYLPRDSEGRSCYQQRKIVCY